MPRPAEKLMDEMTPEELRNYAARLKSDLEKQERINMRRVQNARGSNVTVAIKRDLNGENEGIRLESADTSKRRRITTEVPEIDLTGDSD